MRFVFLAAVLAMSAGRTLAIPTIVSEWGGPGVGPGQFVGPAGIAVDPAGFVYVTDVYNHRVQKFTNDGALVAVWGEPGVGPSRFQGPYGIAVDHRGNVYVADTGNHRIQKFTSDGVFLTAWGTFFGEEGVEYPAPYDVAVDTEGNIYVGSPMRVEKFDADGNLLASWPSLGGGDRTFWEPRLGGSPSTFLWTADPALNQVQKLDRVGGQLLLRWGRRGSGPGLFFRANDVAIEPTGRVHVLDTGWSNVQVFTNQGQYLYTWPLVAPGRRLYGAQRIAIDSSGAIFVTQFDLHRVQKYVDAGVTAALGNPLPHPMPTPAGVVRGRITEWAETGHVIAIGHGSDFIVGWWSIGNLERTAFYANDWPGTYTIAAARDVTDIEQITDASAFEFVPYVVSPLCDADCDPDGSGDFVVWRNEDSGHYAVARLDDVYTEGDLLDALFDVTWWFQPDGSGDFSRFPHPALDVRPGRCPNLIVRARPDEDLPIAVPGAADFAARDVDVGSVRLLERLPPLAWRFEDVTGPQRGDSCDCRQRRADGVEDLVLEYRSGDVLALLDPVEQHETRVLRLDGTLLDGTYFRGADCVTVVGAAPPPRAAAAEPRPRDPILIELATPRHLRVSIYDALGRLVDRPLDALLPAGEHRIPWQRDRTPSGVYFYRIEGGDLRRSGKVVHVR